MSTHRPHQGTQFAQVGWYPNGTAVFRVLWQPRSKYMPHQGKQECARRNDKLRETTEEFEREDGTIGIRPAFVPFLRDESKLERRARHGRLGVRHG